MGWILWKREVIRFLYIPIWFYSNKPVGKQRPRFSRLYIPIWFYSNWEHGIWKYILYTCLYIPIWFYSNIAAACAVCKFVIFTFQSGSIQIILKVLSPSFPIIFTFQSGSIQIIIDKFGEVYYANFTFQSGSIQMGWILWKREVIRFLYIPIWFYSNLNKSILFPPFKNFTFQSGSIQI